MLESGCTRTAENARQSRSCPMPAGRRGQNGAKDIGGRNGAPPSTQHERGKESHGDRNKQAIAGGGHDGRRKG